MHSHAEPGNDQRQMHRRRQGAIDKAHAPMPRPLRLPKSTGAPPRTSQLQTNQDRKRTAPQRREKREERTRQQRGPPEAPPARGAARDAFPRGARERSATDALPQARRNRQSACAYAAPPPLAEINRLAARRQDAIGKAHCLSPAPPSAPVTPAAIRPPRPRPAGRDPNTPSPCGRRNHRPVKNDPPQKSRERIRGFLDDQHRHSGREAQGAIGAAHGADSAPSIPTGNLSSGGPSAHGSAPDHPRSPGLRYRSRRRQP